MTPLEKHVCIPESELENLRCQAKLAASGSAVSPAALHPYEGAEAEKIEIGAQALAKFWGYDWECICSAEKGLNCDCGDALDENRVDTYDERPSRQDLRGAAEAVLKASALTSSEERQRRDTALPLAEHSPDTENLRSENARLKEALKPLAAPGWLLAQWSDDAHSALTLTVGDIRRARAALASAPSSSEEPALAGDTTAQLVRTDA